MHNLVSNTNIPGMLNWNYIYIYICFLLGKYGNVYKLNGETKEILDKRVKQPTSHKQTAKAIRKKLWVAISKKKTTLPETGSEMGKKKTTFPETGTKSRPDNQPYNKYVLKTHPQRVLQSYVVANKNTVPVVNPVVSPQPNLLNPTNTNLVDTNKNIIPPLNNYMQQPPVASYYMYPNQYQNYYQTGGQYYYPTGNL